MVEALRHFFTPHHTNNHRAKALHTDALIVYALVFVMFNFSLRLVHRVYPDILGYATDIQVQKLLDETNAKRAEAGLRQLTLNPQLSQAAAGKAAHMFANNYWAHIAQDGTTPWNFITGAGYNYSLAGENLAKNFQTSSDVVSAWMASPTHKDNIMKQGYREIGFAVVNGVLNGEETTLVVQMFGSQESIVAQAPTTTPQATNVPSNAPVQIVPPAVVAVVPEAEFQGNTMNAELSQLGVQQGYSAPAYLSALKTPLFNIPSIAREITLLFAGVFMGILALDAWIVSKRRIVRIAGHNIGHIAFFMAIMAGISSILPGSII